MLASQQGPPGAPTVLLYSHYDVQPAGDLEAWTSPPWLLTDRDGRWYGRGAADCKGNLVAILTALRALPTPWPVSLRIVCDGSEEQGAGGLDRWVEAEPELFRAQVMVVLDTGNRSVGTPTLTTALRGWINTSVTVETMTSPVHSGTFGGAAPDALASLIHVLASLRASDGRSRVDGLPTGRRWGGAHYPPEHFRPDAGILKGVSVLGGDRIEDTLWGESALTVLGIDCPRTESAIGAIPSSARALLNFRIAPDIDPRQAGRLLERHVRGHLPWHARVQFERVSARRPFQTSVDRPAAQTMVAALREAFGSEVAISGNGGCIPACATFAEAEILVLGVPDAACRAHALTRACPPTRSNGSPPQSPLWVQALASSTPQSPRRADRSPLSTLGLTTTPAAPVGALP